MSIHRNDLEQLLSSYDQIYQLNKDLSIRKKSIKDETEQLKSLKLEYRQLTKEFELETTTYGSIT